MIIRPILFSMGVAAVLMGIGLADRRPARDDFAGEATPSLVRPGDDIEFIYHLTVTRDCRGTAYSWISSGNWIFPLDKWEISANSRAGGIVPKRVTVAAPPVRVPFSTPRGPALYSIRVQFECNPMHYIVPLEQSYPDIPFTVAE